MNWILGILGLVLGGAIGAAVAIIWSGRRSVIVQQDLAQARSRADLLDQQSARQVQELAAANQQSETIDGRREAAERQLAVLTEQLTAKQRQFEEQKRLLEDSEKKLTDTFKAVGADALRHNNQQFIELARETFGKLMEKASGDVEKKQQAIDALIKPIKELLDKQNTAVGEIEKKRETAYARLDEQIKAIATSHDGLRSETGKLVSALRRPEVRGRWGETQLRRVAELTGMIDRCDFTEQMTLQSSDGALRPDMVVHLPNNGTIAVDAKTPLDAVLDALSCADSLEQSEHLDRFLGHIENQVKSLSSKNYWSALDRSPDFVILFIPGEGFLHAATQRRHDLLETAMSKGVVIATPNTLFSLLRVVALGWREQSLNENAQKISELGHELHERLCVALGHALSLGKSLNSSVEHYHSLVSSVESRVLVTGRRLEELGAKSRKDLPDALPEVVTVSRLPTQVIEKEDHRGGTQTAG